MVVKTNENFGGDTLTYSVVHVTDYGRICHRENFADSDDPDERKISVLGFGERFFLYRESYAIQQLLVKLNDANNAVQRAAASELLDCFDFSIGRYPDERREFLQNPMYRQLFVRLRSGLLGYVERDYCSQRLLTSILALVDVLPESGA